jgi:A/G-specific adenine glycosylase
MKNIRAFRKQLMGWYAGAKRDLPWRASRDPYRVWVSEIMLQQTRSASAIGYYERFLRRFPTVRDLAAAEEDDVLALWSGLGYYRRARNLHAAARRIAAAGRFPANYEDLRALPGVGPYTAAAIASIAFGLPHAVVDGNVSRIIARLINEQGDVGSSVVRKRIQRVADRLLERNAPGEFNQAMMELGATICAPRSPRCGACPVASWCEARKAGCADELPVRLSRAGVSEMQTAVVVVQRAGRLLMRRRADSEARLPGFWDLPLVGEIAVVGEVCFQGTFRHSITNHRYVVQVFSGKVRGAPRGFQWIPWAKLATLPVTSIAKKAIRHCHGKHPTGKGVSRSKGEAAECKQGEASG